MPIRCPRCDSRVRYYGYPYRDLMAEAKAQRLVECVSCPWWGGSDEADHLRHNYLKRTEPERDRRNLHGVPAMNKVALALGSAR